MVLWELFVGFCFWGLCRVWEFCVVGREGGRERVFWWDWIWWWWWVVCGWWCWSFWWCRVCGCCGCVWWGMWCKFLWRRRYGVYLIVCLRLCICRRRIGGCSGFFLGVLVLGKGCMLVVWLSCWKCFILLWVIWFDMKFCRKFLWLSRFFFFYVFIDC